MFWAAATLDVAIIADCVKNNERFKHKCNLSNCDPTWKVPQLWVTWFVHFCTSWTGRLLELPFTLNLTACQHCLTLITIYLLIASDFKRLGDCYIRNICLTFSWQQIKNIFVASELGTMRGNHCFKHFQSRPLIKQGGNAVPQIILVLIPHYGGGGVLMNGTHWNKSCYDFPLGNANLTTVAFCFTNASKSLQQQEKHTL